MTGEQSFLTRFTSPCSDSPPDLCCGDVWTGDSFTMPIFYSVQRRWI